jgi:hypothetical protein
MKSCFPCHEKTKASDLSLYSLCTLMLKTRAERNETMATHKSNRVVRLS